MAEQLNKEQAIQLFKALSAAGVDCTTLRNENPFNPEFSQTPTGRQIQWQVEAVNPQLAFDLKVAAGHAGATPSLAMAASIAEGISPDTFEGSLREEWQRLNPQLAQEQQQKAEADYISQMEKDVAEMEYKRIVRECNGDEKAAKLKMRQQADAQKQADAQAEIDREMNEKAAQRNREIVDRNRRMAVLSQGGFMQS